MAKAKYSYDSKRKEWRTRVWDGTYMADGRKHRIEVKSKKSSKDLEDKVNQLKVSVSENGYTKFSSMSFGEYAEHWLRNNKASSEKNTIAMYKNVIGVHLREIARIPVSEIRNSHFLQVMNAAIDKPRTAQQIYITFRQIMRKALKDHIISQNEFALITSDISMPKTYKSEKRALTALEKDAIKKADFNDREKLFIAILYSCGLRREEILALKRSDFDFKAKTVSIDKVIIFDKNNPEIKPKAKSERGIRCIPFPLSDQYREQISEIDGFIFGKGEKPMTKSGYDNLWRSILIKINAAAGGKAEYNPRLKKTVLIEDAVPGLTAHIFRHNYCSELCYQIPKISIKKIAYLLGDTEKMVLEVYNHIIEEKENADAVVSETFQF